MADNDFDFEDQELDFGDDLNFDDEGENRSTNRAFLLLAGSLFGFLILALGVLGVYQAFFSGGGGGQETAALTEAEMTRAAEATAIAVANATTEAQNLLVTQTLVARELTATAPTETPTPIPPTATPTLRPSPTATATPLIIDTEGEESGGTGDEDGEDARDIDSAVANQTEEPPISVPEGDENVELNEAITEAEAAAPAELPETGIALWSIIAAAFGLIGLIFISRRLRTTD